MRALLPLIKSAAATRGKAANDLLVLAAAALQPVLMALGFRSQHRRLGVTVIAAGFANIFQGMYLLYVPIELHIAQIAVLGVLVTARAIGRRTQFREKTSSFEFAACHSYGHGSHCRVVLRGSSFFF